VVPSRYSLVLEPDLATARFTGTVAVELTVTETTSAMVLNAAELTIQEAHVTVGEDRVDVSWELDEPNDRLIVTTGHPLEMGAATLHLSFEGILNDKLRGWYRSTYVDEAGVERVIATSQMQATDCRRAFPCWDEPDFKAIFGVQLVVDEGLLAISNGPETGRTTRDDGKVVVAFADTMPMSTYLVAFVVGKLEATDPIDVNGTPLRVVHPPGKGHLTALGLDIGRFALSWFEEYYGIPYPSDKVDLVALPDFAAGAMENLGCITFRESLLLVDPATSTQNEQQLVVDVVSHELAHMWFGDLVTMRWWNGIWLNEAFATFMEVLACDAFRPDWERWTSFALERSVAFETDSLASTRSVEYEVASPHDSEGMFDVLTYQKGGALLRMLQQYLGEDRFRDGVRDYLARHSYGNTETSDLWDAMERTTGEPMRRLMDSWIWQPGYPLVTASIEDDELVLHQQRFSFDTEGTADPARWVIPVHVRQVAPTTGSTGAATEEKLLLDGDEARLALLDPKAAVVVNAGGHGFYRVAYSPELLARLGGDALASLDKVERYNLVDDSWSAVVAGRLPAADFLSFARGFSDERDLAVWQALANALRACGRLLDGEARVRFQAVVRATAAPALARVGWEPAAGEDDLTAKLRGLLVGMVAVLGDDADAQQRARALFERARADATSVDPELAAAATSVAAATGDEADFERFVDGFRHAPTPQEQLRYAYSLAEFPTAELVLRACEFAMSGEMKTQNAPFVLARCIANRDQGAVAWRFVREHWQQANEQFPNNTIVRMIDPVKLLNTDQDLADVQGFFSEHAIPQAAKTLDQVLERQKVNVALRNRESARLASALADGEA
jgi:puromycin-sensitive aminopeptidase